MKIISFFLKKMKLLTKEHQESYDNAKSNFFNNLSEGIHRIKCKFGHDDENVKLVELNISIANVLLNIQILKMI